MKRRPTWAAPAQQRVETTIESHGNGRSSVMMSRIRAALPLLGPSEQRVAHVIVREPNAVIEWSTAELAAAAGTSPASVIRACQSLGFRGYQHLRLELARNLPEGVVEHGDIISTTFGEAIDAIVVGRASIDRVAFERAVHAIATARRVLMVATGFSGPPAQDAAIRLLTAGRPVEAPQDVLAQQFSARLLGPADVCVAVSYSGANAQTLKACTAAKLEGRATVIAITSFASSPLTRLADIALLTGPVHQSHDVDPFASRLGQSVVLHALHQAILRHPGQNELTERMRDVVADALAEDLPGL